MLTSKKFEKLFKTRKWKHKEDRTEIVDLTLPRMEDKPKS